MSAQEKADYQKIMDRKAPSIAYAKAFAFLSECLAKYHGNKTMILIDEYDVPLENAYFRGFYDEMIDFIRSLFESALKTNPYTEVKTIYRDSISYWFDQRMKQTDRSPLLRALEAGDCQTAEDFINRQLMDTISYFDHAESFYHRFMAGLLTNIGGYRVRPNRESGNGRPGIVMQTPNIRKGCVILLELKLTESIADLEAACDRGLAQIEEQRYAEPFTEEGYPNVLKYAVSFYKKDCMVQKD